ncbi:MAG: hypothetical protein JNL38_33200 [Myxococcales bacterium]|jgi:hypothetical protein|nr:hypothetical protein [Myxococcales bacterium]
MTRRLFVVAGALALGVACGANTGSHANDPQRSICFSSMECASYMRCVKGPNAINGYCRSAHEIARAALVIDAGEDAAPREARDAVADPDAASAAVLADAAAP